MDPLFYFRPNHFKTSEAELFKQIGKQRETRLIRYLQRHKVRDRLKKNNQEIKIKNK